MFTFKLRFDTIKNKPFSGSKNISFTKIVLTIKHKSHIFILGL